MAPPALSRFGVDRAARLRLGEEWRALRPLRVLTVDEHGRALVNEMEDGPRLLLADISDLEGVEPSYFLGLDDEGTAYAAAVGTHPPRIDARPMGLREVGALLGARDAGLFTHALALANWHATHTHCPRCGAPTVAELGGHVRRCVADASEHFPRTDPAVIMLVHDGADRCVLGRQPTWPPTMFSTLAGFVEPGEAAEVAVAREVDEEVGLRITDITFAGSQPWPFPSSLMLAFTARALDDQITRNDAELAEARWFTRAELHRYVESREVLPPPVSIAWRLITDWLAGAPG